MPPATATFDARKTTKWHHARHAKLRVGLSALAPSGRMQAPRRQTGKSLHTTQTTSMRRVLGMGTSIFTSMRRTSSSESANHAIQSQRGPTVAGALRGLKCRFGTGPGRAPAASTAMRANATAGAPCCFRERAVGAGRGVARGKLRRCCCTGTA